MLILQRLQAIEELILAGHDVSVSYTLSQANGQIKAKVKIDKQPGAVPQMARRLLLMTIQPIVDGFPQHVVVDRGHQYSDGRAFANF